MPITYNGTTISALKYNNETVSIVKYNGNTVYNTNLVFNQLLEHGNFDDASAWTIGDYLTTSISSNVMTMTYNTSAAGTTTKGRISCSIDDIPANHVVFMTFTIMSDGTNLPVRMGQNSTSSMPSSSGSALVGGHLIAAATSWTQFSSILARDVVSDHFNFGTLSTTVAGTTWQIKNLMLIDLTEMYGSGNEPSDTDVVIADCAAIGHQLTIYQQYTPV